MDDPKLVKKVLAAFVASCQRVVSKMADTKVEMGKAYEVKHSYPSYDYSYIMGVIGGYKGAITMSMKKETAFHIASCMLGGKPIEEFGEMPESALRELFNLTVAGAFSELEEIGDEAVDITPPTFIRGDNISFATSDVSKTYKITLTTPKGVIEFNISLSNKTD